MVSGFNVLLVLVAGIQGSVRSFFLATEMLSALVGVGIGYQRVGLANNPKPTIIGIDFGTTQSCVAMFQSGVGNVVVIPDSLGNKIVPSIVSFTEKGILLLN